MNKVVHAKEALAAVSLIPESAPFNPEQRAWLNGFFAGMTGIEELTTSTSSPGVEVNNAEQVKEEESFPWHDDTLALDQRMVLADGKPVERKLMAAMAQLDCGSCGYLCQTYGEAIASGEESNLTLCTPGGKETARMVKQLVKLNQSAGTQSKEPATSKAEAAEGYSRKNPFSAKLIRSHRLTDEASQKEVRHVEIDLSDSNLNYEVGDALGLYPTNCSELVQQVLGNCLSNSEQAVAHQDLLTRDLATVTDELCELFGMVIQSDDDKMRLDQLIDDTDQLDELDVLDFLQLFDSVRISASQLIESLPPLNPRLYSIASSLKKHPGQVHLTVGRVVYEKGTRLRKGVASTLLADRVEPGSDLKVFVHKSHGFSVPDNDDDAMIMVGPGTGIAPFVAFLQEREARNAQGKNWLFFGDQRSQTDFLYRDQLNGYCESGLLNRLDTAFSRDQDYKIYVQDRMRDNAAELFQWLDAGASFYVCGDASRMAKDVDAALHEIIGQQAGVSGDEAKAYVKRLKKSGRYMRDVY